MGLETLKGILLPELNLMVRQVMTVDGNLMVRQVMTVDGNLMVDAVACGPPGRCPRCKRPATRVHSR
jgi:hypothetical protein